MSDYEQTGIVSRQAIYNAVCSNTCAEGKYGIDHVAIADALLGKPKTPKPAEPTGLGAVVEDAAGVRWVRLPDRESTHWADGKSFPQRWRDLNVVRVLSEGVESC